MSTRRETTVESTTEPWWQVLVVASRVSLVLTNTPVIRLDKILIFVISLSKIRDRDWSVAHFVVIDDDNEMGHRPISYQDEFSRREHDAILGRSLR